MSMFLTAPHQKNSTPPSPHSRHYIFIITPVMEPAETSDQELFRDLLLGRKAQAGYSNSRPRRGGFNSVMLKTRRKLQAVVRFVR